MGACVWLWLCVYRPKMNMRTNLIILYLYLHWRAHILLAFNNDWKLNRTLLVFTTYFWRFRISFRIVELFESGEGRLLQFFEDEEEDEPQGTTNFKQPNYNFHPGFIFSIHARVRVRARVNVYVCLSVDGLCVCVCLRVCLWGCGWYRHNACFAGALRLH